MALKVVPTKGNLISTKKQLQLAVLGYDLLDKKRNVLIKEMMSLLDYGSLSKCLRCFTRSKYFFRVD